MAKNSICKVDACGNQLTGRGEGYGMCGKHYQRWKKYGDPHIGRPPRFLAGNECAVNGCSTRTKSGKFCEKHRSRFRKHGDPLGGRQSGNAPMEWIKKNATHKLDDCLKWPFRTSSHGRGTVCFDGNTMSAPRAMCIIAHGTPKSPKIQAAHSCGKGHLGCVNPRHLRWATAKENEADKVVHGTIRRGEKVNTNKLSEREVLAIRADNRKTSGVVLAKIYGVTPAAISAVRTRKTWNWL